jgi:CheY-like chemotaxis protein
MSLSAAASLAYWKIIGKSAVKLGTAWRQLLDLSMPLMSGTTAAREIHRLAPQTKIIFLLFTIPTPWKISADFIGLMLI